MDQYLPLVFFSFLAAFVATPLFGRVAHRTGFVDKPQPHKIHLRPIPLLGGVAIYLALAVALIRVDASAAIGEAVAVAVGGTFLMLVGLWDDRRGMHPRVKLLAQIAAAAGVVIAGVQVHLFPWPVLNILVTVFWIVGITNAINLMDNIDGLAAGVSAVAALFFCLLAAAEHQGLIASLAAAVSGASLGFLYYNISPAVVFMGDTGSLLLGFLLAVLGLKYNPRELPLGSTWMVPILVLGLPIFDTTLVTFARWRARRPISQGGTDHTSHRLARLGLGANRAVLSMYLVTGALGSLAVLMTQSTPEAASLMFVAVLVAGAAGLLLLERAKPLPPANPPIVILAGDEQARSAIRAARRYSTNVEVYPSPEARPALPRSLLPALANSPEAFEAWLERRGEQPLGAPGEWEAVFRLGGKIHPPEESADADGLVEAMRSARAVLICRGTGWPAPVREAWSSLRTKCLVAPGATEGSLRAMPAEWWDNSAELERCLEEVLMGYPRKELVL